MSYPTVTQNTPAYRKTNGLAIASFVLALLGFAIIPVIFGHIALKQIRRDNDSGTGFAIVGLVLGYLEIIAYTILLFILAGSVIWAVNA
jgi:peptidyl-prolyl cis-trans isomerase B (cyclophilin B)